jgi:hypothetical protein
VHPFSEGDRQSAPRPAFSAAGVLPRGIDEIKRQDQSLIDIADPITVKLLRDFDRPIMRLSRAVRGTFPPALDSAADSPTKLQRMRHV